MHIVLMCFGISSISSVSGMEKVYVEMANALVKRGHYVTAVWNDEKGVKPFYEFDENIKQVNLELGKINVPYRYKIRRELAKIIPIEMNNKVDEFRVNELRRVLNEKISILDVDAIICYEIYSVMVANRLSDKHIPTIAMCHNSIEESLMKLSKHQQDELNKVDVYQVLTKGFKSKAEKILRTKIKYIPNGVRKNQGNTINNNKKTYKIIHIGRVEPVLKRQMILLKSFADIAQNHLDWEVHYYGPITDVDYKDKLDTFITENNLGGQVFYGGVISDSFAIYKDGDIFAFPSKAEGFGLALIEAMSVGLPSLGFSYAAGVNTLIDNGGTGWLVNDEKEFKEKLEELMDNKDQRVRFGKKAQLVAEQFSEDKIWQEWENTIFSVVKNNKGLS